MVACLDMFQEKSLIQILTLIEKYKSLDKHFKLEERETYQCKFSELGIDKSLHKALNTCDQDCRGVIERLLNDYFE